MSQAEPPVLARGSDADVYALSDDRVLRRYRRRTVPEREVAIMRYVRERGYPAPAVHDTEGTDMVLERVDGPSMADDLARRPWRLRTHAGLLARLHRQLHEIAAPDWLGGDSQAVVHLDLHPRNVLLGRTGPVVIDWANARAGEPELDVALSVVITGGTRPGQPLTLLRDLFVREFVRCFAREEWSGAWDRAVAYRRADRNVSDAEKALVGRLRF